MTLAKLLGFDLCPRLKALKDRHLFVARGTGIPENLRPISHANIPACLLLTWRCGTAGQNRSGGCPAPKSAPTAVPPGAAPHGVSEHGHLWTCGARDSSAPDRQLLLRIARQPDHAFDRHPPPRHCNHRRWMSHTSKRDVLSYAPLSGREHDFHAVRRARGRATESSSHAQHPSRLPEVPAAWTESA